jgi:hypothetical protein
MIESSTRNNAQFKENVRTCVALDVPALKDEPFVWDIDDFRTKINFELSSIEIPGALYKTFSESWQSINENLENSDFAQSLKMSNPLKDEVATITAEGGDETERVRKILKLVTSRMNWNEIYTIWGNNIRQKLNDGAGSSADINFVLNSALRDAGFRTTPILLSPRQFGRLPYGVPSRADLRAFILMVELSGEKRLFVDGTSPDNDINLIPTNYMVDRARIYGHNGEDGWINLTNLSSNRQIMSVRCELDNEGKIAGTMENSLLNAIGYSTKSRYRDAASEDDYVEKLSEENSMDISSFEIYGLDSSGVTEKVGFSMNSESAGAYLYLRSTIVPTMTRNPFTQQERQLPVEFSFPAQYNLSAMLSIPDGYEIEELPAPVSLSACDNGVRYMYSVTVVDNNIIIQTQYALNRSLFAPNEYSDLYTFMGMMVEKNTSRIILKKKI